MNVRGPRSTQTTLMPLWVTSDRFAIRARCPLLPRADIPLRVAQQLWKLGDVGGDAPRFVYRREQASGQAYFECAASALSTR
jgi:hypothetical protein